MKLTQQDMARLLGITPMTLRNWRKDKPKLYEIVLKGFAFEDVVNKSKSNYEDLKALENSFKT
jgi:transcriptional regulator with XRE-family HTH domain